MEDEAQATFSSGSGSEFTEYWIDWFLGVRGNEYFCDIDIEYVKDRFNLTGLNQHVDRLSYLIDVITDAHSIDESQPEAVKLRIEENAKYLYSLIHARYILTPRGLVKMSEKFKSGDFGYCQRQYCKLQALLPVGISDVPKVYPVKLYCPSCQDLYNPKSSRHHSIDGAFFGTSFPAMFLQAYPELVPTHSTQIYIPKVFGFQLHEHAKLTRWRVHQRDKYVKNLLENNVNLSGPGGYVEDTDEKPTGKR
ncbi:unnamed protein product [Kuraishia capsulata CBS 1993]|uniref:Casein kinase II subunit beta n=1 Tax=Kuraishia capsulata CBS 1993 TaxID=1382522 RepID=W6MH54_9ASCO|nr:uncharacterized protein KUCA_T00001499001 [Kuraishia capsulata CBS 1993]CDK25529.1 unnamed protein product [Kuraishia capsulata CBS 1993]